MQRRDFLKSTTVGAGSIAGLCALDMFSAFDAVAVTTSFGMGIEEGNYHLDLLREKNLEPAVRQEILAEPRAVFLIRTHVNARKDENGFYTEAVDQLREEGTRCAKLLFAKGARRGGTTFIKANFTSVPEFRFNRTNGVLTSPDFCVGVVQYLRDLGNQAIAFGETPINAVNHRQTGIYDAFDPYNILMIEGGYQDWKNYRKNELNFADVEGSLIWKKIPYYRPIMDKDNFLINIATLKSHLTALTTLTVKNVQGCVPKGLGQFCNSALDIMDYAEAQEYEYTDYFRKDYFPAIERSFLSHRAICYKYWEQSRDQFGDYDRFRALGGWERYLKIRKDLQARMEFKREAGAIMRQEMWIHRGLDNIATLKPRLNVIAGIIGMDGNEHGWWKIGEDRLVNIVIAGVSPIEVDAVGSYVMGHDPREIWYLRAAKERGLGESDINKIAMYWLDENGIEPIGSPAELTREPLGVNWARENDPTERLFW